MHARLVILVASAASIQFSRAEEGAQYLQNTIEGLRNNNDFVNTKGLPQALQATISTPIDRAYTQESVPSLHLTKAELAALYQSAVRKGETIKLDSGDGGTNPINAAVHQLDSTASNTKVSDKDSGYYYYYYPLKSFMDELSSGYQHEDVKLEQYHHEKPHHHHQQQHHHQQHHHHPNNHHHDDTNSHVHSHTHQHNVHIESLKNMMDMDKKSKGLEPLFMAISGFIGMTIMFILSILVLPKFDKLKPKNFKSGETEMTSFSRIAIEAVEGKDCAERLACEAGKAAKAFNLYDNRFVKLVRRMAPMYVGKQIDKIGKYTDKKYKCAAIQCKRKEAGVAKFKNITRKPKIVSL